MDAPSPSQEAPKPANPFLQAALDFNVRAIWLSFGNDLKKWIDVVREHDKDVGRIAGSTVTDITRTNPNDRTLIFVQVNSVEAAVEAVIEWGVDAVSLQGMLAHSSYHPNRPVDVDRADTQASRPADMVPPLHHPSVHS